MKYLSTLSLLLFIFLAGCSESTDRSAEAELPENAMTAENATEELTPANMAPEFIKVLNAHGGLDRWNGFEAVTFQLNNFPKGDGTTLTDVHRVNLISRKQQITSDDYVIVSNGETTWVTPGTDVTGIPPRMYQAASFYLFGMPFVFADEGLTVTYAGETEFGDETMDQYNVQVPDGMGDGGNDYQLYADPQTNQLRYGTWTVAYPAVADQDLRQMASFEEWQTVSGIVVPSVITMFTAPGEITEGTPGATFSFDEVVFNEVPFAEDDFDKPANAVIDQSGQRE